MSRNPLSVARLACALLAATALGCASFGSVMEAPEVSLVNLEPLPSTALEQRYRVDLRISNPNERPLEVDGLRFELEVNGQRLARGQTGDAVSVPRLGDAMISVDAATGILDLVRQLAGLQDATGLRYRVKGRIFLKGLFPPYLDFDREDELLTLPEPPAQP